MAGGNDNGLQFVVLDALLYRFEVFVRNANQLFTETALSLSSDVRIITNASHASQVNLFVKKNPWQGQVIINRKLVEEGVDDSGKVCLVGNKCYPNHIFFGRENAVPISSYHVGIGDPEVFSPKLEFAIGRLLPLIIGGIPRCPKGGDPGLPGCVEVNSMTEWFPFKPDKGKVGAGIHRASGCLFLFCQEDGAKPGIDVATLIKRMLKMGVDDAVLGDGSDSACLVVDKVIHIKPGFFKNKNITTGFMFRLCPLDFKKGSFWDMTKSTDPFFQQSFRLGDILGQIRANLTSGGLEMNVSSFGAIPSKSKAATAASMGIKSLPVHLKCPSTDLTSGAEFESDPSDPEFFVTISKLQTALTPGSERLRGIMKIREPRGELEGNLSINI